MKKLIALLLALVMVLAFAACGADTNETEPAGEETTTTPEETTTEGTEETTQDTKETPEPVEVMTYEEFMAAEAETQVVVECAVQGHQSWWDNKITVYAADENGGYFLYELACSEEDAAKLTEGTWIRATGVKAVWEGQVEIMEATFEFVEKEAYVAEVVDVTELVGTDELEGKMTLPVLFKGATIEEITFKNDGGDDIYVTAKVGETSISFCVELYLTGTDTEVYQTVSGLKAGDVVDIQAYLYWYQGPNPHITGVTVAE